ncbi:hypothetical protein [Micromonospora sp. RTGN7]|uniref:hypothetical protein n=1 Tax=Micromonospora sp. RTGN7 TaxID=3016526 RepID=UPI0029FF17EF|nr:hypothetical protein [Micromonospora sp. RTGN7]
MPEIFGDEPRPWVIVDGIDPDDDIRLAILKNATKVTFLDSEKEIIDQVRQADYDAYVVVGEAGYPVEEHLFVLQFGGSGPEDNHTFQNGMLTLYARYDVLPNNGCAERLFGPDESIFNEARELARISLAPFLQTKRPRDLLYRVIPFGGFQPDFHGITPLVSEQGGAPCAGYWSRPSGASQWWWLPEDTPDAGQWISAVFAAWRRTDPARFPSGPDWSEHPIWMTQGELAAQTALEDHLRFEQRTILEMADSRRRLQRERVSAKEGADTSERLLLTAQGDILVGEVQSALIEVGFTVIDVDSLPSRQSEKLEDLRVSHGNWVALAEVKGYGRRRTAKTNDLQQVQRAVVRYVLSEQKEPNARWYVVNQMAGSDPASRPRPLASSPEDVTTFAKDGGLVIDTAELFKLREGVRSGDISSEEARNLLCNTKGVFSYPAATPE